MAFTYVTIVATYETAVDLPARGIVEFTPIDQMHNGLTVISATVPATLDPAGSISARLAATTDPATKPVGVTYRVDERITGQPARTYYVSVPHDQGATLQLANLTAFESTGAAGFALRNAVDYDDSVAPADGQVMTWDSTTTKYHPEAPATGTGAVSSVNGATGAVTITASGLGAQPIDTDLTAFAALAPADGSLLSRQAGAWSGRAGSQVKTDLAIDQVNNTSDANKPISTAAASALAGKAATVHTHAAADLASGTIAPARLGSGSANATTFLRGDNTWVPPGVVSSGFYRVDDYGATGNWVGGFGGSGTNDTAAVQAAINAAPAGATLQFTAGKTYRLDNLLIQKPLTVDGNGASIVCNPLPGSAPLIWFQGSLGTNRTIASATEGATTVTCTTVADAGTFTAGDYVVIEDRAALLKFDGTASVHTDGRSEINRVVTADGATGVVTLGSALEWPYATSPRISKATLLDQPVVRGFSSIVEIDPGAWGGGLHEAVPHLIHFTYCVQPRAERVAASHWNLHVVNFYRCLKPLAASITARDPLRAATGGHGYLMRFDECIGGVVRDCVGHGVRHLANWVGSYDCASQGNVCYNPLTAAYQTHGIFNKRAVSSDDTSFGGVNGWSFGNPQFRDDVDMVIERPHCVSAGTAILARSRCQRLAVVDPDLHIAGTARGVHVCEGAGRVTIRGGTLEAFSTGNQVLVRSRLGTGDTLVASPGDVAIVGTRMIGGTQTLLLDSVGELEVRDVVFDTPAMGSTAAALIGIGTSEGLTPTGVRLSGVAAGGGAYQNAVQIGTTPTGRYALDRLHCTGGAVTAPAAANLRMSFVRAATLTLSGDAVAAATAGARLISNTPATYDSDAGVVCRVVYTGSAYPARPAGVVAGFVEYVGPVQPTTWLAGDTWIQTA